MGPVKRPSSRPGTFLVSVAQSITTVTSAFGRSGVPVADSATSAMRTRAAARRCDVVRGSSRFGGSVYACSAVTTVSPPASSSSPLITVTPS
jgi:hypothetical protein